MSCFVCDKHRGQVHVPGGAIYEDDLVYIGHRGFGDQPGCLGYIMIDSKRHAEGLGALTDEEAGAVGEWANRVSRALRERQGVDHVYAFVHGDHVPHFHLHVVPRYADTPEAYRHPLAAAASPTAPKGGDKEIEEFCGWLRERLEEQRA